MAVRLRVPEVDDPDFVAEVDGDTLRLVGSADTAATRALAALLETLHTELLRRRVVALVVDLTALDFMSSGCLRELVAWFGRLEELAADARYAIRLRSNPTIAWQRSAIPALTCFGPVVVMET